MEMYMMPVDKKTGKEHCPICYKELELTEEERVVQCKRCKKYFASSKDTKARRKK